MNPPGPDTPATLLAQAYDATTRVATLLTEPDLARATRTAAWTVAELLFHQLLDAQRSLVALASPSEGAADVDAVTYWAPFRPTEGDGGAAHARFVQVAASAYAHPATIVDHWTTTSAAVVRAARALDPAARVQTQGHVISVADLASTLVVEATVHLLDLTLDVPGAPHPSTLAHTRDVLQQLQGAPFPTSWSDPTAVLLSTGRLALSPEQAHQAGDLVSRWPLLG